MPENVYYLDSDNVNVFPSTRRIYTQDFSAKLMTELAISRITNMLINTDGFIISSDVGSNFRLNIHGYYFELDSSDLVLQLFEDLTSISNIYASILIEKTTSYPELRVPAELNPSVQPEAYDSSVTYIPGQLVTYDGNQYQCISETTGTWDSSKWVQLVSGFQGLIFTSFAPTVEDILGSGSVNEFEIYTLKILEKDAADNWIIPSESKYWLDLGIIDGGVIL